MLSAKKTEFIEFMIRANVLCFGEFITKSGRHSPYFINSGNYTFGSQTATLGRFYADAIVERVGKEGFDALFGPAYKGIPLVTAAAAALFERYDIDKPFFFNRKEEKDHGEGGLFVGYQPKDGERIVIVEDVITAGTAIREVMPLLQKRARVTAPHLFISVNRCEAGQKGKTATQEVKDEFGIEVHSLIDATDILAYLEADDSYQVHAGRMRSYMDRYCVCEPDRCG